MQDEWQPCADLTLNLGLRYDLHEDCAQPPVRNPDAQLAAAGIDTSRARRRHEQLRAAPRRRLDAGTARRTSCAAAAASSTAARRRSCSAPRTRTTASTSSRSRSRATPCRPIRRSSTASRRAATAARPTIFYYRQGLPEPAAACRPASASNGSSCRDTSLTVDLPVRRRRPICRARSTATSARSAPRTFTVAGTGETLAVSLLRGRRPAVRELRSASSRSSRPPSRATTASRSS